jgi:hypothetical protein
MPVGVLLYCRAMAEQPSLRFVAFVQLVCVALARADEEARVAAVVAVA